MQVFWSSAKLNGSKEWLNGAAIQGLLIDGLDVNRMDPAETDVIDESGEEKKELLQRCNECGAWPVKSEEKTDSSSSSSSCLFCSSSSSTSLHLPHRYRLVRRKQSTHSNPANQN